jgi:hypothetical protein
VIPHDTVLNALRKLNFSFKRQTDRVDLYKQKGSPRRVSLSRNAMHDPTYVRIVLKQAGMPEPEIERFIQETDKKLH